MKFETTGNKAIDLCQNIIFACRAHNESPKALWLNKLHYEWFKSGAQTLMDRELETEEGMQLDGVEINCGDKFQTKPVVIEYYEKLIIEA